MCSRADSGWSFPFSIQLCPFVSRYLERAGKKEAGRQRHAKGPTGSEDSKSVDLQTAHLLDREFVGLNTPKGLSFQIQT